MLKIVYSNNIAQLASHLAQLQQSSPLPPLEAETVIVQSNELTRWLSLFLAQRHGIVSHIDFPYPSAYLWALFRRVLPSVPKQSPFSTDAMAWRIFELLPACRQQTQFAIINAYLGEQDDPLKRYALSHRIADSFDQYLMYRPDWIQAWEQGETPHWQAALWQLLTATEDGSVAMHRANLLNQLHDYLTTTETRPKGLPERLAIFGISAMPPVYLTLFELMARHCDITLYFLSPSEGYWGDLVDKKTQAKRVAQRDLFDESDEEDEDDYFNTGHPLLASLGKQGQEFFEQLQSCQHESFDAFIEPERDHVLGMLQHDIFALNNPDFEDEETAIPRDDKSIMVHACHSTMREIEVLHDQLLALFEHDPDLSPTDIVVMTPDIEVYAPWIDAVFANTSNNQRIPYGIADCGVRYQSPILNAFVSLLSLPQSRFDVETVLTLLECQAIQHRFSLDDEQLSLIREWLAETHTRWALSAEHKADFDLPETKNNTWRAGLDRLLLAYAMPMTEAGKPIRLFEQQLAFDGITGDKAATLAQLCAFMDSLDNLRQQLTQDRTAENWQKQLNSVLENLFLPSYETNEEAELNLIRQTLAKLVESTQLAEFEQTMSLALVKDWINGHLDTSQTISRFMGHGVTFCGMVPMRSIPFKVVCLIGMNDDSYPRRQPTQGFDLLSHDFRVGDRSRRDDDRYLFLEALMSCQSYLYLSYVGRSIRDNATIPPSVLVSDLRDVLNQTYTDERGEELWPQLLTQHPLQAFNQRYYDGQNEQLFSFAQAQCPINDSNEIPENKTWFEHALPQADDSWRQVSLSQLINFFRHPARYLLRERLGMRLEMTDDQLDIREPFELDGLQAWSLRQQLLSAKLNPDAATNMLDLVQASGVLPQGIMGEKIFDSQVEKVDEFADKLLPLYPTDLLPAIPFELQLNDFVLSGQLGESSQLHYGGLFHYRMAKTKGHDLLTMWINHLVLNAVQPTNIGRQSTLITENNDYQFSPVENAHAILQQLIELYWQGIHQPLPLFSNTSYAFAKTTLNNTKASPEAAALSAWLGGQYSSAEADDVYYQQLYKESPLNEAFLTLALAIYEPIHAHLVEGEL
ncbi:MAG TPA: exodeoxyribonuclease V subunit gamma [Methylophaga sp.]|nr:exodeoxyribonuclease V subunit gamma [Methylophaga sp.]